jgi:hypothetical protein
MVLVLNPMWYYTPRVVTVALQLMIPPTMFSTGKFVNHVEKLCGCT